MCEIINFHLRVKARILKLERKRSRYNSLSPQDQTRMTKLKQVNRFLDRMRQIEQKVGRQASLPVLPAPIRDE